MAEKVESLESYLEKVAFEELPQPKPGGWYSQAGDCIFYFREPVPYYAQRVDKLFTAYRAEDDKRIIGLQIKGIKNLPEHDLGKVMIREFQEVEIITLILYTFQRQQQTEGLRPPRERMDTYMEAIRSLGNCVRTEELEPA